MASMSSAVVEGTTKSAEDLGMTLCSGIRTTTYCEEGPGRTDCTGCRGTTRWTEALGQTQCSSWGQLSSTSVKGHRRAGLTTAMNRTQVWKGSTAPLTTTR